MQALPRFKLCVYFLLGVVRVDELRDCTRTRKIESYHSWLGVQEHQTFHSIPLELSITFQDGEYKFDSPPHSERLRAA